MTTRRTFLAVSTAVPALVAAASARGAAYTADGAEARRVRVAPGARVRVEAGGFTLTR